MTKRKYSSEEVIHKLREAEVLLGQGKTILEVEEPALTGPDAKLVRKLPRLGHSG